MKHFFVFVSLWLLTATASQAQMNIGSNTSPDSSAMLQISGIAKGFLPPRMTTANMMAIANPAKGLVIFNTTDSALFMRRDSGWVKLFSAGTVTSASIVPANGLSGSVVTSSTTPAITLSTTVTGMVKGNGTALSAATAGTDYAPGTAANTTGIVKSTTSTGALTTAVAADFPTLNQNTTGTASNITGTLNASSLPAFSGDVTSTAGSAVTTISNGVVTNAKLAAMAANTFKANNTGTTSAATDITGTQATAMLDAFNSTAKGLVPASGGGTTSFLRADGTFAVPAVSSSGTVTSVSVTPANGVSGTVANNSTTPAITLTLGAITPSSVAATGIITGTNLSGTNTGDETTATIKTKLGTASATTDGYLTQADWNTFNNKASVSNTWSITGNTGTTAANFIGTTDNKSFRFRTNNVQRLLLDSLGNVAIGASPVFVASPNAEKLLIDAGTTSSYNLIGAKGSINDYLQLNISNKSSGNAASTDLVATADNGDESSNFIDMGINSSGFNGTGAVGGAGTAYLYSTGNNLAIGNGTANKSVIFFTGGLTPSTYTERFRLDASGRVGIGTSTPTTDLSISQSTGTGGSRGIALTGNSIGGTNTGDGFLLTLGYNATGNKQLWLGDPDYAGNAAGTFVRYISAAGYSYFDGINGTNTVRSPIGIGYGGDQTSSGVILGADENATHPGSYIWANGNMTIGNTFRANAAPSNGLLVQGNVGMGVTSPTAVLQLKAGTAAASTAPLKLTAGSNLSTPEAGAIEFDGTNYYGTAGSVRYTFAKVITNSATLDFPLTLTLSSSTLTIALNGAADGDAISLGIPNAAIIPNGVFTAYVSASNIVTVKFNNTSSLSLDPAAGKFTVSVIKQ